MRVVHPELNFPEELEDLGGDPLLYLSCVCLPGVLVLHVRFLDQVPAAGWYLHSASRIHRETLKSRFSGPLYFVRIVDHLRLLNMTEVRHAVSLLWLLSTPLIATLVSFLHGHQV